MAVSQGCEITTSNSKWYLFFAFRSASRIYSFEIIFVNFLFTDKLLLMQPDRRTEEEEGGPGTAVTVPWSHIQL